MMTRVPNWDLRLLQWAESMNGKPFAWGETDCGSLVRSAMQNIYGVDAFGGVGRYSTRAAALKRQSETGGVYAALTAAGWSEIPLPFAQQGDVLIHPGDGMPGAGVVVARQVLITNPDHGVQLVSWRLFRAEPDIGPLLRGP